MEQTVTDNRKAPVAGMAFHSLSDKVRQTLKARHILTAGDILRFTDRDFELMGIPKNGVAAIDKCLKALSLKRGLKGSDAVSAAPRVKVFDMNSILDCGPYEGLKVSNVIAAQAFRSLRHLYYTVDRVDFTPEVAEAIKLKFVIEKPGTAPDIERILNNELDNNIHGILKMKIKNHISKDMRAEAKARSHARDVSREQLQAHNHGHMALPAPVRRGAPSTDLRPFAQWIRDHGYDHPRTKSGDAILEAELGKLYKSIRSGVSPTLIKQGEIYLANLMFLNIVTERRPQDSETALGLCFSDFDAEHYYHMLDLMGLSLSDVRYILTSRRRTFPSSVVTNPYTGNAIFLMDISLLNNPDENGFPRPSFQNENTWENMSPEDFFAKAEAFTLGDYSVIPDEGLAISVKHLAEALATSVHGDAVANATRSYAGRGRRPLGYNLKKKNGRLYIRKDDGRTNGTYVEAESFIVNNPPLVAKVIEYLKNDKA